jgi:transposase
MYNFLLEQKKKDESIAVLESFIKSNPDARELKRAIAIKMAIQGESSQKIVKLLGVSEYFIRTWKKAFASLGLEGIKLGYRGAKGYLSPEQKQEVTKWLQSQKYWHLEELVNHLEREYGVVYQSKQSYYTLFSDAKISWKKTQKSNPKLNEELVEKKQQEIQSFLEKNKAGIGSGETVVLFIDESHLLHGDTCGYVWGHQKIRLNIPIKNEREKQTYFGALNYQTLEFTLQSYPTGNGAATVEFVQHLQQQYPNKKLVLIWDGASYHKYGEFREFLQQTNQKRAAEDWLITCLVFAPNAPQQNPVEDIWLQAKNFLRKYWHLCTSFPAVKKLFELFTQGQKFDFPKIQCYRPTTVII